MSIRSVGAAILIRAAIAFRHPWRTARSAFRCDRNTKIQRRRQMAVRASRTDDGKDIRVVARDYRSHDEPAATASGRQIDIPQSMLIYVAVAGSWAFGRTQQFDPVRRGRRCSTHSRPADAGRMT